MSQNRKGDDASKKTGSSVDHTGNYGIPENTKMIHKWLILSPCPCQLIKSLKQKMKKVNVLFVLLTLAFHNYETNGLIIMVYFNCGRLALSSNYIWLFS